MLDSVHHDVVELQEIEMKTGGPAFPYVTLPIPGVDPSFRQKITDGGMTLRDYFAAKALIAWYCNLEDGVSKHPDSVATWCYQLADAMLKAREE